MTIAENIIKKIQSSHLVPLSRDRIKRRKYLLWLCVCMFLGLGAFIVSFFISDSGGIIEFVELDTLYAIFVWIVAIFGISFLIYRDSRNIWRLYRYSMKQILGTILAIMIFGWLLLHFFGGDVFVQNYLIKHTRYETIMSTYTSWNKPEAGRLIGEVIKASKEGFTITDMSGRTWNVEIWLDLMTRKHKHLRDILEEGNTVRILWNLQENKVFVAQDVKLLFE